MSEVSKEAKTSMVRYICDECGDGEMLTTGMIYHTNPPQWEHRCNQCGTVKSFPCKYPDIRFVEV